MDKVQAPPAAYATRRNTANPSFGARAAAVANYLGTPFMPWQRQVADVCLELDTKKPGAWRYPLVVVSVPRQAGKTALLRALLADRLLNYERHEIMTTAQTGKDARKRWNQLLNALRAEKKPDYFRIRAGQGSERLEYIPTGSYISPFAPTPKSIHGDTLHLVAIDEAWAFDAVSGAALEAAINPTMLTVLDSQIIIVSTKGTASSAYLNGLIERGRAAVNDPLASMAYFEWSANIESADKDPFSDETLAFHPAIGHTQTIEKIRAQAGDDIAVFRRSYLNLETAITQTFIEIALLDNLKTTTPLTLPPKEQISIAFDCSELTEQASIWAAWKAENDTIYISMVEEAEGTKWLADSLNRLYQSGYKSIGYLNYGAPRAAAVQIKTKYPLMPLTKYYLSEYGTACHLFTEAIKGGTLVWESQTDGLRTALQNTATKLIGGATAFDAHHSTAPIDPLRAAALAILGTNTPAQNEVQIFI